ncbi:MAG: M48 family metalloprotease [Gammaproteobacteria bacterium]|nr:M48 family metalloprotease [Gammaproteobacteria bacterium]
MNIRIAFALLMLVASGCVVNPVTGKSELSLVTPQQEVALGEQQYIPSRQMQGGDYVIDEQLTAYVSHVGHKLAEVSDRPRLPYEFVVLNNSTPNAWALPGGKIAINRGLLLELNSEAELAAVLSHEIVHAAARHSAKQLQHGMLTEAALMGLQMSSQDNKYSNLIVGSATVGAGLLSQQYSRSAELESDRYGMKYMKLAGYDPNAAVELQRTFLRLSEGRQQNWLSGLFASHPASQRRVDENIVIAQELAAEYGAGGSIGANTYQQVIAKLRETAPAYENYEKGRLALKNGDDTKAEMLAQAAISVTSREAKFYELLGDVAYSRKDYRQAEQRYDQAVGRNPTYFQNYLGRGLSHLAQNDLEKAKLDFEYSNNLLPTATAHLHLGDIAHLNQDNLTAIEHFRAAAGAGNTATGKEAQVKLAQLELQQAPERYLSSMVRVDSAGEPVILIQNRAPISVSGITVELQQLDEGGRRVISRRQFQSRESLGAGQTLQLATGMNELSTQDQLSRLRSEIVTAQPVRQ